MTDPVVALAQQGLALDPLDRKRLVALLLDSLEQSADTALDSSWASEIERRLAEHDRGEVEAIDGDIVLAEVRRLAR